MKIRPSAMCLCIFLVAATAARAAWTWTPYLSLADNYVHPTNTQYDRALVLATTANFNSCGWNNAGQVIATAVGDEMFNTLTATFLVAWTTDKQVSLLMDGCDGDRARIIGIKLAK